MKQFKDINKMKHPKEKAHNLIEQMLSITNEFNEHIDFFGAKQCAIIAVNEIIKELDSERVFERIEYWNEVLKEIKNL
jgi:hypothetical protein